MVVDGLEIKPYLFGNASYASQDYLLHISNQLMEIWIKSSLINKWMLVELTLTYFLGFLKIGGGSYITLMHMLIKLLELWWFVV